MTTKRRAKTSYWDRQAHRRFSAGYKQRQKISEQKRAAGLKEQRHKEYQRRAKLGQITKRAKKMLNKIQQALDEDYEPDVFVNFQKNITKELEHPRDYEGMQQSLEYLENSEAYDYYFNAKGWDKEGPVIREQLGRDISQFWRIEKRLEDLGYGSFQSIDMIDHYQQDNGGIPAYEKMDDIMMAIVKYDKTGEDEYNAATAEADNNGDDFWNMDDDFWIF